VIATLVKSSPVSSRAVITHCISTRARWAPLLGLILLLVLTAAACGGSDENGEEESEGGAKIACSGDPVTPNLPADFPEVEGLTYTESSTAGQSEIADGYFEGDLEEAYNEFKSALEGAGYTITFDEIEEDDSEVAYKGGDENRSGIVALRKECEESGRISVHITSRPA
jgi:hypothetical protein